MGEGVLDYFFSGRGDVLFGIFGIIFFLRGLWIIFFSTQGMPFVGKPDGLGEMECFSSQGRAGRFEALGCPQSFWGLGEVMKERRRREREKLINLSTCGCVIQNLWGTHDIE